MLNLSLHHKLFCTGPFVTVEKVVQVTEPTGKMPYLLFFNLNPWRTSNWTSEVGERSKKQTNGHTNLYYHVIRHKNAEIRSRQKAFNEALRRLFQDITYPQKTTTAQSWVGVYCSGTAAVLVCHKCSYLTTYQAWQIYTNNIDKLNTRSQAFCWEEESCRATREVCNCIWCISG